MKTIDRLKEFIDYKGLSLAAFDKAIGAGTGYIGKQVKRSASIGSNVIETIVCKYPELNANWLVTGDGEMLKQEIVSYKIEYTPANSMHANEPEPVYKTSTPRAINGIQGTDSAPPTAPATPNFGVSAVYLAPQIITVDSDHNDNILYVPVKAAAGYLTGYADPTFIETLPSFTLPGLRNKTYRAFEVDGDSMYPTLENKEMIIGEWVEKLDYIREDRVHILVTKNQGVIVKRLLNRIDKYGFVICKSDALNDRNLYPNIEVRPEDIVEIWYGVWHGGFSFKAPGDMWKRQNNLEADLTDVLRRLKDAGL